VRVLGFPVIDPRTIGAGVADDALAALRVIASAPAQVDRLVTLGEELVTLGRRFVELGESIDARAGELLALGERMEARAAQLLDVGANVEGLADRIDSRGEEIVRRAGEIVDTGSELIAVLPTLERAIEMTTPLEGAIDRFGRLVDRLPGGPGRPRGPAERSS
jgi:hypothetical protein